jgi:hypothetical protein
LVDLGDVGVGECFAPVFAVRELTPLPCGRDIQRFSQHAFLWSREIVDRLGGERLVHGRAS